MQNDWFTIFKVKATARAHMSKIWQFQLYFLNCWSFCYQTLFDSALSWAKVSYKEIELLYSRSRLQQNFKMSLNVNCLSRWYLLNAFTTKLSMVVHQCESDCLPKRLVCCLQGQGHSERSFNQNITFQYIFWAADPFLTKVLMAYHHKLDCGVKRLDCCVLWSRSRTQERLKIPANVHLGDNCRTFCNQTWYGGVSLWAGVSWKKIGLLSLSSRSQWRLI